MGIVPIFCVLFVAFCTGLQNSSAVWSVPAFPGKACLSGQIYNGFNCVSYESIYEGDCAFPLADSVATGHMPALETGVGLAGSLRLQISAGFIKDRLFTGLVLSQDNPECNYDGISGGRYWVKGVDRMGCLDLFNATLPWAVATGADGKGGCGLSRSEDETHVNYDGVVEVRFVEQLPAQRGALLSREVVTSLPFRYRFPKRVEVEASLTEYAAPRLLSAVTAQEWDADTRSVQLQLQLQLQAPFRVASWAVHSGQAPLPGIAISLATSPIRDCADQSGRFVCTQTFEATLTPLNSTCTLDGQYSFDVVLACQDGVARQDCPIDPAANDNDPVTVSTILTSGDLCAVAETSVGASGRLSVHRTFDELNFAFGEPQSAFFQDDRMHFRLRLSALDGFQFAASEIETVRIALSPDDVGDEDSQILVYQRDQVLGDAQFATKFNELSAGAATHEHQFSFLAAPSVFGAVPQDESRSATVIVSAAVTFGSDYLRKRSIAQMEDEAPERIQFAARFTLVGGAFPGSTSGSTRGDDDNGRLFDFLPVTENDLPAIGFGVILALVLLFCCIIIMLLGGIALFVHRRRLQPVTATAVGTLGKETVDVAIASMPSNVDNAPDELSPCASLEVSEDGALAPDSVPVFVSARRIGVSPDPGNSVDRQRRLDAGPPTIRPPLEI